MSYLCPDRRPVGYTLTKLHIKKHTRREDLPKINKLPESKLKQIAMFLRFRFIHKDRSLVLETKDFRHVLSTGRIIILVNEHTRSTAEMVAACKGKPPCNSCWNDDGWRMTGGANFKLMTTTYSHSRNDLANIRKQPDRENAGIVPDVQVEFALEPGRQFDSQLAAAVQILNT